MLFNNHLRYSCNDLNIHPEFNMVKNKIKKI